MEILPVIAQRLDRQAMQGRVPPEDPHREMLVNGQDTEGTRGIGMGGKRFRQGVDGNIVDAINRVPRIPMGVAGQARNHLAAAFDDVAGRRAITIVRSLRCHLFKIKIAEHGSVVQRQMRKNDRG